MLNGRHSKLKGGICQVGGDEGGDWLQTFNVIKIVQKRVEMKFYRHILLLMETQCCLLVR